MKASVTGTAVDFVKNGTTIDIVKFAQDYATGSYLGVKLIKPNLTSATGASYVNEIIVKGAKVAVEPPKYTVTTTEGSSSDALPNDNKVNAKMENLQVADAMTEIFNVLRLSNKYIDETTPWVLAKDEAQLDRLETVIYNLLESIRVCGSLLEAFMPETSIEILRQINSDDKSYSYKENNNYELGQPSALFQRIDKDKLNLE